MKEKELLEDHQKKAHFTQKVMSSPTQTHQVVKSQPGSVEWQSRCAGAVALCKTKAEPSADPSESHPGDAAFSGG